MSVVTLERLPRASAVQLSAHCASAPHSSALVVRCLDLQRSGDSETLRLGLRIHGREQELYFRFRGASVRPDADAWAALALPLAMRLGVPLRLQDPISAAAAACLRELAAIYAHWYPDCMTAAPLEVEIRRTERVAPRVPGAACFFSGGIDSFYCARKHQPELSHLIFVHGFDIPVRNVALRDRVLPVIRRCAAGMDRELVEVETNLREITDPVVLWGRHYLTAGMAVVPLLLGGSIRRCYVPSDVSYAEPEPWGSHPTLTPLFSSPAVTLIHAGAEAERIDRLRALVDDPLAQTSLRVCWQNVEGEYNCGRCQKCLHDMCALRTLGRLADFSTFTGEPDLAALARLDTWHTVPAWGIMLAEVRRRGTDRALEQALVALHRRSDRNRRLRAFTQRLPAAPKRWARSLRQRLQPQAAVR